MQPLQSNEIIGSWATIILPINEDESIDFIKLTSSIDCLIDAGVSGIYSNGTAGEFYNQTEDEFYKINTILADKCNRANMPFQIGCNHVNPMMSLERVRRTKTLAPGAIQVILPDWFPPTMAEIISYLKMMVAEADPIGIVLYNPPHAKRKLTPLDFYDLQQAGIQLAGCKVSGGDDQWYAAMKEYVPNLSLFVPGHHLATGISKGANGSYSNVACINPATAQRWFEDMKHNLTKAMELQSRIQLFISTYIFPLITEEKYSDPAIDKFLGAITGWADIGPRMRWPYRSVDIGRIAKVRAEGKLIIPEFFIK